MVNQLGLALLAGGTYYAETVECNSTVPTAPPPVYLSLSSTNYISGLNVIPLSSVGEGRGSSLVCHTDLSTCCQQRDSGMMGGKGVWNYPNGLSIGEEGDLYVNRDLQMVRLNRRSSARVPSGIYCCVVPTSKGSLQQCIFLSKWCMYCLVIQLYIIHSCMQPQQKQKHQYRLQELLQTLRSWVCVNKLLLGTYCCMVVEARNITKSYIYVLWLAIQAYWVYM